MGRRTPIIPQLFRPARPFRRFNATILLAAFLLAALFGCVPKSGALKLDRQKNAAEDARIIQEAAKPAASSTQASSQTPPAPSQTPISGAKATPGGQAGAAGVPGKPGTVSAVPSPVLTGPVTLDEAVKIALKYNLDTLVAAQEKAVTEELATGAKWRLLPTLIVDAEQSWKNRETPSSSVSFETRQTSLEPSISSDLWTTTMNATLAWDLVNLGVNVYRKSQAGSRALNAEFRLKRLRQNVALDVVRAYLKAAAAKDVMLTAESLHTDAKKRRELLAAQMNDDVVSRAEGLVGEIDTLELAVRFHGFREQYRTAKAKLAELMGIDPTTPFELAGVDFDSLPTSVEADTAAVETAALANRPELYEQDQDQKISKDEADIARMQMFPALSPFVRYTYDANTYLLRHDWFVYGLRLSWDLFSVPRLLSDRQAALDKAAQDRMRRLKTTQAIMVQARLVGIDLHDLSDMLPLTRDIELKRKELVGVVKRQIETGKLKDVLLLDEWGKYLTARIRYLGVYTDLLAAKARLRNTMGLDWGDPAPSPELDAAMSLSARQPSTGSAKIQAKPQAAVQPSPQQAQKTAAMTSLKKPLPRKAAAVKRPLLARKQP